MKTILLNGEWEFKSEVDSEWTFIQVPGAYAGVQKSFGKNNWDVYGYPDRWLEQGAVYRRSFSVPEEFDGRRLSIYCGACFHHSRTLLNGIELGEWHDGYMPFEFELPVSALQAENVLEIHVEARRSQLFDDYKTYNRGIWEDVELRAYGEVCVPEEGFIQTSVERQELTYAFSLKNSAAEERCVVLVARVTELDGEVVKEFHPGSRLVPADGLIETQCTCEWSDATLWFPHDPQLYSLEIEVRSPSGELIDTHRMRFGFREITWSGPHLYLNGRELYLRGHGGHSLGEIEATRAYAEAWLKELMSLGINFMRLHDNPKHQTLYDVADELGFMLEAEPVFHFHVPEEEAVWQNHLCRFVKRFRNRPSIIMWSVSNELRWNGGGEHPELIDFLKLHDQTRPAFASDFSLESLHGDLLAHHYNPGTVRDEWAAFGPDKPMVWDELGLVWPHGRALDNGDAGFEVTAHDYATGIWADGHPQIYRDLTDNHDGWEINGELHRVNAYCIWDFAYNFFRWLPFNNNQTLYPAATPANETGSKPRLIKSGGATVNPWDATLPTMDPNPGFYCFDKLLKAVRFQEVAVHTLFDGGTFALTARTFYDDLRFADEVETRVETSSGKVLTSRSAVFSARPGEIIPETVYEFDLPSVEQATPACLVRQFKYQGVAGHSDYLSVQLFPSSYEESMGVWAPSATAALQAQLQAMGIEVSTEKEPSSPQAVKLCLTTAEGNLEATRSFVANGGRAVIFQPESVDGMTQRASAVEGFSIREELTCDDQDVVKRDHGASGLTDVLELSLPLTAAGLECEVSGIRWQLLGTGDMPESAAVITQGLKSIGGVGGRLTVTPEVGSGSCLLGEFMRPGEYIELGECPHLELDYVFDENLDEERHCSRVIRVLLRGVDGAYLVSRQTSEIGTQSGSLKVALADFEWCAFERETQAVHKDVNLAPPERVMGYGIMIDELVDEQRNVAIDRLALYGQELPYPTIPLHGEAEELLDGLTQPCLSHWRGGAATSVMPVSESVSARRILLGDRNGIGTALEEVAVGAGVELRCALRVLEELQTEPAAAWTLRNLLRRAASYSSPSVPQRPALLGRSKWGDYYRSLGIEVDEFAPSELAAALVGRSSVIIAAADLDLCAVLQTGEAQQNLRDFVEKGGRLTVHEVGHEALTAMSAICNQPLTLTVPFMNETSHCVKAAISWRRRDTPNEQLEYYSDVFVPQPFEANYDSALNGVANIDLDWNGTPMFSHGLEVAGADPTAPHAEWNMLLSNWKIDWARPYLGGEYPNHIRDMKHWNWFVNRDAVALRVNLGSGSCLFCQLDLPSGGDGGARLWRQLWGNFTTRPTSLNTLQQRQLRQFEGYAKTLSPAYRRYQGSPQELLDLDLPLGGKNYAQQLSKECIIIGLEGLQQQLRLKVGKLRSHGYNPYVSSIPTPSSADLEGTIRKHYSKSCEVFLLSFGLEDLRRTADRSPVTSLADFEINLTQALDLIKADGVTVFWASPPPIPRGVSSYCSELYDDYYAAALEIMRSYDVYVINMREFFEQRFSAYVEGSEMELTEEMNEAAAEQLVSAVIFFGAQAF